MTIMKGDSYPIYIELVQDNTTLTPEMVAELEVCVGESLRKLYTQNEVMFDKSSGHWYIWPTQEETLALNDGACFVIVRVKYKNEDLAEVKGMKVGVINVIDTFSEEVI